MSAVHAVLGFTVLAGFVGAALLGGLDWFRRGESVWFWHLLRTAQIALVVECLLGAGLLIAGEEADRDLHLLYALLPIGILFMAEQLRLASADIELGRAGYDTVDELREQPRDEQEAVAAAIVRRELMVMAIAAGVSAILVLRAAAWSPPVA